MLGKWKQRWKKTVVCVFSAILMIGTAGMPVAAADQLNLYAQSYCVMEANTGRILMEKNGDKCRANASTTKILTCLYVIEHCDLNATVKVSKLAASQPKVHLQMRKGEEYKVKDLLYALMLESYNDCAYALAEYACGSVEKFEEAVNQEAVKIGASNTHFVTPNGLDQKDSKGWHRTTAKDLALIMRRCIKNKTFLQITRTKKYTFKNVAGTRSFECYNHNVLLTTMKGAISGKTGYTDRAGYCYIGAVEKDGITYIVALLRSGVPSNWDFKWRDMNKIITYAGKTYERKQVAAQDELKAVSVSKGVTDTVDTYVKENKVQLICKKKEQVQVKYDYKKNLVAPVKKNQKVGTVSYYIGNKCVKKQDIFTSAKMEEKTLLWQIKHFMSSIF